MRRAVREGELAALPAALRDELEAALAAEGALVPFSLLRRLHAALREAGRPRCAGEPGSRRDRAVTAPCPARRVSAAPTRAAGGMRDPPARGAGAAAGE